ncbi:MAG: AAA family ATPase [Dehalococcoidia bacterium]|nr:AAA family ATPase [Dehalococcoidia bacterium]
MEKLGDVLNKLRLKGAAAPNGTPLPDLPAEQAPAPPCPRCHGLGWVRHQVPVTHPDFGKVFPCACQLGQMQSTRNADLLRYSGLQHMARFTFATLAPEGKGQSLEERRQFQKALAAAQAYAKEPTGWLVLTGPSGCGKTHLAAAIAHRLLENGRQAFFASVPDLLDQFRASFSPSSDASAPYSDLFQRVANAPVLALDDLGAHSGTPWAQEKLLQLLNQRYNLLLPTVITLSVPLSQLDERLRSRLGDATVARVVEVATRRDEVRVCIGRSEESLAGMRFATFETRRPGDDATDEKRLGRALALCEQFAETPLGWFLLIGPTLQGKTHLLASVFNERKDSDQPVAYAWVPALLEELRSTFSPGSEVAYSELFDRVKNAPVLLLDDLGSEHATLWAQEKLYQLLVHRHDAWLPTVVATHLTEPELRDGLPAALVSRLLNETKVEILPIGVFEARGVRRGPPRPTQRRGRG